MGHASLIFALVMALAAHSSPPSNESASQSGPLYDELAAMDQRLFDIAFVECDPDKFRALFADDAEFYHDLAGPTFGEEARTLKGCPRDNGVRRVLVADSLEVYPMQGYGAIQMGEHWFIEEGASTSTLAKFVHLWQKTDGEWRLARVLSFDHQSHPRAQAPAHPQL